MCHLQEMEDPVMTLKGGGGHCAGAPCDTQSTSSPGAWGWVRPLGVMSVILWDQNICYPELLQTLVHGSAWRSLCRSHLGPTH